LIAQPPKRPAHLAPHPPGIGWNVTSLKLTEQTKPIRKPDWTCFVVYIYSKGIRSDSVARNDLATTGFWHLTLCTLLSSQGSDAPGFHHTWLLPRA